MNPNHKIEVKSLSGGFKKSRHLVFQDVSFSLGQRESIAVMGSSGVGKTVLIRTIAGILPSLAGDVFLNGKKHDRPDHLISVVFQNYPSFPWLNIEENVNFGLKCLGDSRTKNNGEHAKWILEQVGLADSIKKYPKELSGGMLQRLAIARSLAVSPNVLILDEPFSALDPLTKKQLKELILKLQATEGFAFILVTHDLFEAFDLTQKCIILSGKPATARFINHADKHNLEEFSKSVILVMANGN